MLTARAGPAVEAVERDCPAGDDPAEARRLRLRLRHEHRRLAAVSRCSGPAGTKITLRPAELVHADGTIDPAAPGSPIYDDYTLSGRGVETWHPEFIYHGFQYIQVEGLPTAPTRDTLTARSCCVRPTRPRDRSPARTHLINGIHRIIDRATQSNMFSVLTDCPTREKLGWMEEDHLVFDTVARNYDIAAYGHDLVRAMADAQLANGLVPDIAPGVHGVRRRLPRRPELG